MDAINDAAIATVVALVESRRKSVEKLAKEIEALRELRKNALPAAADALTNQLYVKTQRHDRLVAEWQAYEAELVRLRQPSLPGVPAKAPTVVKK